MTTGFFNGFNQHRSLILTTFTLLGLSQSPLYLPVHSNVTWLHQRIRSQIQIEFMPFKRSFFFIPLRKTSIRRQKCGYLKRGRDLHFSTQFLIWPLLNQKQSQSNGNVHTQCCPVPQYSTNNVVQGSLHHVAVYVQYCVSTYVSVTITWTHH